MLLSSIIKQTEEILDEVLRTIRLECEKPSSVLCEADRTNFVEEEEDLRKRLRDSEGSKSNWRNLLCIPSPQAVRCLEDAEALHHRVKEEIRTKLRTMLPGMGGPPSLSDNGQGSAVTSMDARKPEADPGRPLVDANAEPASTIITSPLNMRCSVSEVPGSELIVYPVARKDNDYTYDLNETVGTLPNTSSDRSRDTSSRGQRRSPPPPPPPPSQRTVQSSDSRQTTSNSGSGSSRGSRSIRRPPPPPPQSTRQFSPGSPINGSFPSFGPFPPNLDMMSSISELTQQAQRLRKLKHSGDYTTMTNCVDIRDSNADGVTLNIGGSKNSGAVVHKMMSPQPVPV